MTLAYVFNTVLNSSILIFFFYTCFAALAICFAYFIEEEVQRIRDERREQRELLERSTRPLDIVVDEIYES